MLSHSFDRFYVVTKFILPSINGLKFLPVDFDSECSYLNVDLKGIDNQHKVFLISRILVQRLCHSYKKQINYYNKTVHDILTKEIPLILQNFPKNRQEKRGIITLLVVGFIGLAHEGISSYLHNKRQKALKKASVAMENQVNLERNKIFDLEDSMVMYSIYNSDTLKRN